MKKIDLTNQTFSKLKVIKENGRTKHRNIIWECLCECGTITNVPSNDLIHKNTFSCGCHRSENMRRIGHKNGYIDLELSSFKHYCFSI